MSRRKWTKAKIVGHAANPFRPGTAVVVRDEGAPDGDVSIVVPAESGVVVPMGAKIGTFRGGAREDEVEYAIMDGKRSAKGPVQVSTSKYRTGWENTFGKGKGGLN